MATISESKLGVKNPRAKLTEDMVYCFRVLKAHCKKPSNADIAKEFGIVRRTIECATIGDTWQHVPLYFKGQGYNKRMRAK